MFFTPTCSCYFLSVLAPPITPTLGVEIASFLLSLGWYDTLSCLMRDCRFLIHLLILIFREIAVLVEPNSGLVLIGGKTAKEEQPQDHLE